MKISYISLLFCFLDIFTWITCNRRDSSFNQVPTYNGFKCRSSDAIFEYNVTADVVCTSTCLGRAGCKGVFYSPSTTLCTGCGDFLQAGLEEASGDTKYYYNSAEAVTWETFNGSSYSVHYSSVTFDEAKAFCTVNLGGYVVHFDNRDEVDFVNDLANTAGVYTYYIGLEFDVTDNKWKWGDDNTEPTFTDFEPGEPNGYPVGPLVENCAAAWGDFGKKWADYLCHAKFSFVCEKETIYRQFIDADD